ncbi:MAG: metalloregulator ArsR/SmtB family transcription factor [Terriglobales bacterium]|jgi:ArsR family transcriptional regulator
MANPEVKLNDILHAVADPARQKILHALKEKGASSVGRETGLCASDIEARIPLSQPTISHHMAILRRAGLVEATRMGQWILYRRNETVLRNFIKALKRGL